MERHASSQKQSAAKGAIAPSPDILATRPFTTPAPVEVGEGTSPPQFPENAPLKFSIFDPAGERTAPLQAKLTIGAPNDPYEQEADRVAAQVVQQINAPNWSQRTEKSAPLTADNPLQMQSEFQQDTLAEEEELQMKPVQARGRSPEETHQQN